MVWGLMASGIYIFPAGAEATIERGLLKFNKNAMKTVVSYLLNFGYWIVYLVAVSIFYYAITEQKLMVKFWPIIYWKVYLVIVLPSVVCFYWGYYYLFRQITKKMRKQLYSFFSVILSAIFVGILWVPFVNIVWQTPRMGKALLNDFLYYIQTGLPLSLLWFTQVSLGLGLKVFSNWINTFSAPVKQD